MPRPKSENAMTQSEKNQYHNNYNTLNYERFHINSPREEQLMSLIDAAVAAGFDKSRQSYVLNAIRSALRRDGMLPAVDE